MSMLDWNAYRQQLTVKVGEIARLSPDTVKDTSLSAAPVRRQAGSMPRPGS